MKKCLDWEAEFENHWKPKHLLKCMIDSKQFQNDVQVGILLFHMLVAFIHGKQYF